jgi:hypothetical protein
MKGLTLISKVVILASLFVGFLYISQILDVKLAHAQTCPDGSSRIPGNMCETLAGEIVPMIEGEPDSTLAEIVTAPISNAVDKVSCISKIGECIFTFAAETLLRLTSLLTGISGVILNGVVLHTVVNMAESYRQIGAIDSAWGVIRDVANMGFIFVLMYAAIQKILGIGKDTQKLIVNVIVVAILINFSLFATQLVIDASNIIAITFYESIAPGSVQRGVVTNYFASGGTGISGVIMDKLSLASLYQTTGKIIDMSSIITIGFMGSLFLLIASFVFFAIAFMLIIRYVVLILVLILSPIAFVAMVFPGLKSQATRWKDALIGQALFAPIFFMLIWITLYLLDGIMGTFGGTTTGALSGVTFDPRAGVNPQDVGSMDVGFFTMVLNFVVVIVFLITSLIVAKQFSDKAGSGVSGINKWAMGAAGGATFGMAGRAGRLVAGGATMSPDSEGYKRLEARSAQGGLAGATARLRLAATDKARTSSFDARGGKMGLILGSAGIQAGKAQEGGFEADKKAYGEFVGAPGTETHKKRQERSRKAQTELDIMDNIGTLEEYRRLEALEEVAGVPGGAPLTATDAAELARLRAVDPTTGKSQIDVNTDAFERAINSSTTKEIEAIVESNRDLLSNQVFANKISVQQLEALNKSDKFTEAEKDTLKNGPVGVGGRFAAINAGMAAMAVPVANRTPEQQVAVAALPAATRILSETELEMINPAHLSDPGFASGLRGAQIDAINKNTKFTTSQRAALRGARQQPLVSAVQTVPANPVAIQTAARRLNAKDLIGLMNRPGRGGINVAVDPAVLPIYTPQILKRMAPDMDPADIITLRNAIIAGGDPATRTWLTQGAGVGDFA